MLIFDQKILEVAILDKKSDKNSKNRILGIELRIKMTFLTRLQFRFTHESLTMSDFSFSND